MSDDRDNRMRALEARVAALEAGKLAPRKPAPRPPVDEGVRITYLTTTPAASLLPTDAQLTELRSIVLKHRPRLAPDTRGRFADQDQVEFDRGIVGAFRWLATVGRADEINHRAYFSYWCDCAEQYLSSLGTPATIRGNAVMVAVLAWGDIAYVEGDNFGNVPALGLATYGGRLPTSATWQRVLASKQILMPTPGRFGTPASSRVVYG
jgi:hypothetical protein